MFSTEKHWPYQRRQVIILWPPIPSCHLSHAPGGTYALVGETLSLIWQESVGAQLERRRPHSMGQRNLQYLEGFHAFYISLQSFRAVLLSPSPNSAQSFGRTSILWHRQAGFARGTVETRGTMFASSGASLSSRSPVTGVLARDHRLLPKPGTCPFIGDPFSYKHPSSLCFFTWGLMISHWPNNNNFPSAKAGTGLLTPQKGDIRGTGLGFFLAYFPVSSSVYVLFNPIGVPCPPGHRGSGDSHLQSAP